MLEDYDTANAGCVADKIRHCNLQTLNAQKEEQVFYDARVLE